MGATQRAIAHRLILGVQVSRNGLYIGCKSFFPQCRYGAGCLWEIPLEFLSHFYVTCFLQFSDLDTQVARRRPRLIFQVGKVSLFHTYQDGDHRQPQLGMQ